MNAIDTDIFLYLNGQHTDYFDNFMWLVTRHWYAWGLIIAALIYVLVRQRNWRQAVSVLLAMTCVLLLTDQISAGIIKPLVCRLRPSRALGEAVHTVNGYIGGKYGFVSSHAANYFGIATLFCLLFRKRALSIALLAWAALIAYSRIYVGVHYPGDILGGTIVGVGSGFAIYALWKWAAKKYALKHDNADVSPQVWQNNKNVKWLVVAIIVTLAAFALMSI
ncbi:MAG: phosphatase PAP2 family protein [Muribaculaceae bacterium]|nr:phosphatase PAP2 family protein [Muribaculaceae bacterium]